MTKYGQYKSLVGFAPDWEWVRGDGDKASKLPGWINELATYRAGLEFHLIGFGNPDFGGSKLPTMTYGYDGQGFGSLASMFNYFQTWHGTYAPNRTGVYWGYDQDASWLRPLIQTPAGLKQLQDQIRNQNPKGMIFFATEALYYELDGMLQTL